MDYLIIYLLFINIFTLVVFALDKSFARRDIRRIPEKTLIGLAVAGGGLGGFFAMRLFRHKTRHKKFSVGLPVCCILWTCAAAWFLLIK